jgi:PAS domain S-box-containing protein
MKRDHKGWRPQVSWLPIAVLTLSLVCTLISWWVVKADEKSHIRRTITSAVASVRSDLSYDMESWIHEQVGLADLWKIEEPSYERWKAFADTYLEHHPGCLKLEWLDTDYHEHWIIRPNENRRQEVSQGEARERLLASALHSGQPAISQILTTGSGEKYWLAAVPLDQQKQFHGFVLASFDAQRSLDAMMDDIQVLHFSVAVEANGNESYRLGGANDHNENEWMTAFDVPLPGNTWRMRIWPKPEGLDEMRSGLPALTVLFGTALSLLLAWIAHSYCALRLKIAERRHAEEALRESEERFSGMLGICAHFVISTDAEQRITLYNHAAETTFGYTAEEALEQKVEILIPERLREVHRQHITRFAQSEQKSLHMSERYPIFGLRKDGTEFPMAASISKLNVGGKMSFTILGNDITAQVRIEEELRSARDNLELRVTERTADLARANLSLQSEVTDRIRAEKEVQELSRKVMRVQNEERRRLSRELHDGAIQNIMAVALNLNSLHQPAIETGADNKLNECAQLLQQSMNELRTISHLLHPPMLEELGVVRMLSSYVDGFSKRSGIQVKFQAEPELDRLDFEVELTIFRIAQEALANIHRHSRSSSATIALARDKDDVVLEIADLGRGIPERAEGIGLGITGMRERVRLLQGKLEIKTSNKGVTIRAILPLSEPKHLNFVN